VPALRRVLDVSHNAITGVIPSALQGAGSLEYVQQPGCFPGAPPLRLCMPVSCILSVDDFVVCTSAVPGLRNLDLSHNLLVGSIPSTVSGLSGIQCVPLRGHA
jgi:hypothetical protein